MIWIILYVANIYLMNLANVTFGFLPVGFGLLAPAGVYFSGLGFTLRDAVHNRFHLKIVYLAIAIGAGLSALLSPSLALASATAFVVAELADTFVYMPLRKRSMYWAIVASGLVGLVIDSMVFLLVAFGSLQYIEGQVIGKIWVIGVTVGIYAAYKYLVSKWRS
jgi:uncharacterized PurR-regulated membrane protein YhhQ (DUF165 family)